MLNSETFLNTFADIEVWLRQQAGADRGVTFYQLVERATAKNGIVRRFASDLKQFADLRNAIVHERGGGRVIAEPNNQAVADFERIRAALLKPPTIIPQFRRKVSTRFAAEPIADAVSDMHAGSFSQLPILVDGIVVALLTSETIVRWLASEVGNDLVSLMDTEIAAVLPHAEDQNHYCYLARSATLQDAIDRFEEFTSRGKDLNAILISEDGRPEQALLGILTVYDLPTILETLGLRRISAT